MLSGGGSRTVKLSLNGTGRALLARFRTLPAYLTVSEVQTTGSELVVARQRITFRAESKKKKRS